MVVKYRVTKDETIITTLNADKKVQFYETKWFGKAKNVYTSREPWM